MAAWLPIVMAVVSAAMGASKENKQAAEKAAGDVASKAQSREGQIGIEPVSQSLMTPEMPQEPQAQQLAGGKAGDVMAALAGSQGQAPVASMPQSAEAQPMAPPPEGVPIGAEASGGIGAAAEGDITKYQQELEKQNQNQGGFWGDMSGFEKFALGASVVGGVSNAMRPPTPRPPATGRGSYSYAGPVSEQFMGQRRRPSFRDIYGG